MRSVLALEFQRNTSGHMRPDRKHCGVFGFCPLRDYFVDADSTCKCVVSSSSSDLEPKFVTNKVLPSFDKPIPRGKTPARTAPITAWSPSRNFVASNTVRVPFVSLVAADLLEFPTTTCFPPRITATGTG